MQTLTSGLDHNLDRVYDEWETTFGFGPCGAYAAMRREDGWGDVAVCTATDGTVEFTHYVIVQGGAIIDLANPLGEPLEYSDLDTLDADEMPELVTRLDIRWLRERMA